MSEPGRDCTLVVPDGLRIVVARENHERELDIFVLRFSEVLRWTRDGFSDGEKGEFSSEDDGRALMAESLGSTAVLSGEGGASDVSTMRASVMLFRDEGIRA